MDIRFWLSQAFNGISYGALLFLVGSGLSLIFGVMRIVNLAHGSYFLLGSYVALSVIWTTGSWLLAIPAAAVAIGLLGLVMERVFLRPLGFDPLRQVLLTVGFALLFQQAALDIWGGDSLDITPPAALKQSIVIGGLYLPLLSLLRTRPGLWHDLEGADPGGIRRRHLSGLYDRHRRRDRAHPVARHGEDAHRRCSPRHGRRCGNGPRRRDRHLADIDVHLRPGRAAGSLGRSDRRRLSRRLSRARLPDPAGCLRRRDHRRDGQPWGRRNWRIDRLTRKQERFVQEYLLDLNATQAAIRAGYSAKAARVAGCKNITKANIAAEIEKAQTKRAERCEVTADWVIDELRKLACANMADYMKSTPEGGIVLDFAGLTRDQTAALSQVKVNGASVTFKLHDKRAALVDLGRYLGLFDAKRKQQDIITVEADFTDVRDTIFRTLARLSATRISKGGGQIADPEAITEVAE